MARHDRYSAKLLFEFRVTVGGSPGVRRLCEERIILIRAGSAREAYREVLRQGRASEYRYRNTDGNPVHFRLVGILDLLRLGVECQPNEVWYDITQRDRPSERRDILLPRVRDLHAFREEALLHGGTAGRARTQALPNKQMQRTRRG